MSRAVPSSFSEYLIDSTSSTRGIRCDGGIMPLRTDPDPRSFGYKKCLRGEDLVFLCEAVNARGLYGPNRLNPFNTSYDGPYGPPISAQRMAFLDQRVGAYFTSGRWTDLDPSASLGVFHSFGGTPPSTADVVAYVESAFHPIARHGNGNSFSALDSAPVENMFRDVGLLNYTFLKDFDPHTGSSTSGHYPGLGLLTTQYLHTVKQRGYYNEPSPRVETTDSQQADVYAWRDYDRESYDKGPTSHYPGGLDLADVITTTGVEIAVSEGGGGTWRSYNRYLAVRPYCVVAAQNRYSASWRRSSDDSSTTYGYNNVEYVWCPLPVTAYIDMLTPQTVVLDNQSMSGWAASVFAATGLEQYASDLAGQYVTTDYIHRRERDCTISAPSTGNAVWIAHFLYCNLEGVVPAAQPQQAGQP